MSELKTICLDGTCATNTQYSGTGIVSVSDSGVISVDAYDVASVDALLSGKLSADNITVGVGLEKSVDGSTVNLEVDNTVVMYEDVSTLPSSIQFVGTGNIYDDAVTTDKIADGAITSNKVDFATTTANGMYFSFGDGYRVGWEYVTKNIPTLSSYGSVYYADVDLGNWDVPFEGTPRVWVSCSVNQVWVGGELAYTSATKRPTVRVYRPNNVGSNNSSFSILYIGK